MEFAYLIKALFRRKWIIIISVLLALIASYLFTKNTKRQFQSTAQFSTGFTVSEEMKLSDENFNVPQIDLKFNNVIENITSAKVITLVSYQLMLHDLQSDRPFTRLDPTSLSKKAFVQVDPKRAIKVLKSKLDSIQALDPTISEEKALLDYLDLYDYDVETLQKELTVTRNQRTDYVNIVSLTPNPFLSAFMANTLLNEFKRFFGVNKRERSDVSIGGLDSLMRLKKANLDAKVGEKTKFMSNAGLVDPSMEGSSALSQINSYENQLIEEKANQQNLNYRVVQLDALIKTARSKGLTSVNTAGVNATVQANDRSEYTRLRSQYNDLYSDFVQKGSRDADTKRRLDEIQKSMNKLNISDDSAAGGPEGVVSLDQLVQKDIDAQAQLKASNDKINSITNKLSQLNGGLNGMAGKQATIQQFDKDIELASAEYKEAKEKLNLATNNESTPGNFKQTLTAQPASQPEPSKKLLIIGMAGAIALVLSSMVIVLIEFFDHSIRSPSNFQRLTNLPVLGLVNWVKFGDANILERIRDEDHKRSNTFRELLRKLRYEVEHSGKKIFLFTSTIPQQGKTSIIQALSYSLSLVKKRVLIIDTNFCNNDLTRAVHANPSLEKFSLNGKPFNLADLKGFVTPTAVVGIDMIGCEGGDYTPSEILPKNHLLNYLDSLKEIYDVIFLEGAPLNGFTDTKELLQYADTMIAIFSVESALSSADRESIQFLQENKDKFLGVVLNKIPEDNLDM
ncbi:MAG TPA: Wzz/FepE/Etk N-terminal domain-containing protein [Puia sp.]|jgi:uncharacterized protein involved in exopolysaccharide biosynthesis|nr:Wzz/FepE/Etk N-terminal domain-containing protein [Puia sp.]